MTSKERAQLRAQANGLEPLFQIGKGGFSDALVTQTQSALKKRELIKIKVLLESAPESPREFAEKLAQATESEVVQVIGGVIVIYKKNLDPDNGKKSKPAKKGKPLSRVKAKRALAAKREASEKQAKSRAYMAKRAKSQRSAASK